MNRAVLAGALVALLAAQAQATSWVTEAFRASGGGLVQTGDTMIEVRQSAGEPLERRLISRGIALGGLVGVDHERWTYRGSDGIYILTFAGHRLARIEVVPFR